MLIHQRTGKSLRVINYIIDYILIGFIFSFLSLFLLFGIDHDTYLEEYEVLTIAGFNILYFTYYCMFEYLLNQTPGKMLTKTKVINIDGTKPNLFQVFIRTISRLIHLDMISYIFGENGMHDLFSQTTVVNAISNFKEKNLSTQLKSESFTDILDS